MYFSEQMQVSEEGEMYIGVRLAYLMSFPWLTYFWLYTHTYYGQAGIYEAYVCKNISVVKTVWIW